jgi:hypothetical protein
MKKAIPALLFVLILFSACSNKQALENKVWKLVNVNSASTAAFLNHMEGELSGRGGYSRFLRFYKDGTYTGKLATSFDYGTWTVSGKELTLKSNDHSVLKFTINKINEEVLILNIDKLQQLGEKLDFQFEAKPVIKDKADDAYSLQNNSWQIKAKQKETDAQLLERVKGHVLCQLLYIQKAIENKEETISIAQFASPIKFYGNGLGLKPLEDVSDEWKQTFFDTGDMNKAYHFFEQGFQARISVPDSKNRFIMYKGIFEQLYLNLRKIKL